MEGQNNRAGMEQDPHGSSRAGRDQICQGRSGLVMEGGAMRGMFTAGVLDVLMENGITFDGAIGVSAGATFGCNIKSLQIGRTIRYNLKYCRDWRYASVRSLLLTGDLYGVEFDYHRIPSELDPFDSETFIKNPMEFYCVCTDAETGEAVYHRCETGLGEDLEWIRGSASMPGVSKPVMIRGRAYLDGGISDSIPLEGFEKLGYEKNVVILTQPDEYRKKSSSLGGLMDMLLKKYPATAKRLRERPEIYNRQKAYVMKRAQEGAAFLIRPKAPLGIPHVCHDAQKIREVYDLGRKAGEEALPALRTFLRSEV